MKVVKSNHRKAWKILLSSFCLGIIPWKTYYQRCDGCSGGQGCSDVVFDSEAEAISKMLELRSQGVSSKNTKEKFS